MNHYNNKVFVKVFSLLSIFLITSNLLRAQQFNLSNNESSVQIFGTSSLHDWHLDAESYNGVIVFKNVESGEIDKMKIDIVAESLKSGKSSMDRNTYKALKTDEYNTISFQLAEVKESISKGEGLYSMTALGDLTISGVKNRIPLEFSLRMDGDKLTLSGEKKIKMTDYKVDPPKALLGTITTGDDITIKFNSTFK